ncbi:potassium/sodium hyperpolarization-activated cyclic nucleotide-gated channel 4-like isoform X1 [Pieris napi]|uniref:potassium/sodium hyperpolarization-activated cyclic nucleotide-gated channel 4-like isoform X1 n=4 Tax=Pieris napi TaxID=78633 RepID=UPI001FBBE1F2|nr:potassium/sodium hyperpolarization-activated cyclic nucleotide-gated channel 4-like isoform X1 [Pieris napi]XP_047504857.1 potassium/sodium hyperpolarization-activated cyclic nucleotide-gated channel 4-like isoform X1 [Pieris napi]
MTVLNVLHMCCSTFRLCFVIDYPHPPQLHKTDIFMLFLNLLALLDTIIKFNTGFFQESIRNVVMLRKQIACRYLRYKFWIDFLSCVPLQFILLITGNRMRRFHLLAHLLPLLRIVKLRSTITNLHTVVKIFTLSFVWHRSIHHLILFAVSMHWSSCFLYTPVVFTYYWTGSIPKGYNTFLKSTEADADGDITKFSICQKYLQAFFVCLSTFFGTGFSTYKVNNADEFVIHSCIILYASLFMVYTVVFLLKIYMTQYNSTMRYNGLINQVEAYMQQKQFPKPLKERVFTFYTYKYENKYYKEDAVLDCLSEQLGHEIVMHTCNRFIQKVKLLRGLAAHLMGELMSYLKPEEYLASDLIARAGDIGDCVYFIAYGTVAVYSLKGAEITHLEDGDHFGTVAMLMKDSKRIATVVAVEITHLYRLDAIYFRQYLMSNKIIRERVETKASKRMHVTVLLDEEFRRKQEKKWEDNIVFSHDFT